MTTLQTRFEKAFEPSRHRLADLARAAGVKPPSVSDWFTGNTKSLKAVPLIKAAEYLGVSPLWLATGEGPMRPMTASPFSRELLDRLTELQDPDALRRAENQLRSFLDMDPLPRPTAGAPSGESGNPQVKRNRPGKLAA